MRINLKVRQIPYVFIKLSDYIIYPMRLFFGSIWGI